MAHFAFTSVDFGDRAAAARRLRVLADAAPEGTRAHLLPHLQAALAGAANPDRALINLERFILTVPSRADTIAAVAADPRALEMLVTLFAGSQFLTDILLRTPEHFENLIQRNAIGQAKSPAQHYAEAYRAACGSRAPDECSACPETLDGLRRYHHWELLRIGTCDLIGLLDLTTVTAQLSQLADSVIWVCLELLARSLGMTTEGFVVLGMGKLGGRELNYSSDVDLLFLADGDVAAFQRLGERLIKALTEATSEGFLYRVDMRLRPWGRVGPLISTVDGYLTYLARDARLWEKQALLRARVVAGDEPVGTGFLRRADPLLFSAGANAVRAEVHAMKQLTEAQLRQADRIWGDVKLGEGSIRDAEFVAQYLQLAYGKGQPELRTGHTLEALARLGESGYLRSDEYRVLVDGYTFLRTVEHYLQILDYRQTHTLPTDPADLRYLARRLGFTGPTATDRFVAHLRQHGAAIRSVYLHHLDPLADSGPPTQRGVATMNQDSIPDSPDLASPFNPQSEIARHLARLSPSYAATFSRAEIAFHAELAARLNDRNPVEIAAEHIEEGYWRVTIVAHDYLGELSLICGLLFAHGLSIVDGHVYTYEAAPDEQAQLRARPAGVDTRRKIVDVFTVKHVMTAGAADTGAKWRSYATDLAALLRLLEGGRQREAQGELAKRVALAVRGVEAATLALHPIDIAIRSAPGERYTRLQIESQDTPGFLYEFTNALALNGIHIAQVSVATEGNRVRDILHVTDARGSRITSPERERELRAATVLVKHFTHLLPQSPDPELALQHFNEYLGELFARPSWPDELASLERPEVLGALARLLGVSDFLWDDFLRMQYANLFPVVQDVDALATGKTRSQLATELAAELATAADAAGSAAVAVRRDRLNAFKDREMFRVDMRQILGQIPAFGQFSAELTDLAEVIVEATTRFCTEELLAVCGEPRTAEGVPARLCVAALGKCGGRELGFASDIELMFVYEGGGETTGPKVITTTEFYERLVVEFTRAIRARREGIFEIDLQLRPYGKAGSLAVSLDAFRRYFAPAGPAWSYERQALVKLRPIAGDEALGRELRALCDDYVYAGTPFDVAAMRAMRERQLRHLVTPGTINAKYSQGGLAELEYIVQGLQITHGAADLSLRVTHTGEAIARLAAAGVISAENGVRLNDALLFLHQLINALRMVRGNTRDLTVPAEASEEFAYLARRLGYGNDPNRLGVAISEHMTWVQRLGARLLG
jgi:[glutamine synthetase] adenylyltransferase / [glutamine synthetase]-adenylyl-L-tyrosine phosphorylase